MICLQATLIAVLSSKHGRMSAASCAITGLLGIALWDGLMFYGPLAMPGTMLGLSVSESFLADGWVPLIGSFGLTLVVLAINGIWVFTFMNRQRWSSGITALLAVTLLPLAVNPSNEASSGQLSITTIQPGSSPDDWADVTSTTKAATLFNLLESAQNSFPNTDVFVLPETALPISSDGQSLALLQQWADSLKVNLVSGAIVESSSDQFYNAAVAADSSGASVLYKKRRLVPFVESVPMVNLLPFADSFRLDSGGVSSYQKGNGWNMAKVQGANMGLLICFESFFPQDGHKLRKLGAQVLLVLTQDGWWQSQTARRQHEAYTRLMALSSGLPVVQASVDGISASWDGSGQLINRSSSNGLEMVHSNIALVKRSTLYSKAGETPSILLLSFLLILYLARMIYFRSRS